MQINIAKIEAVRKKLKMRQYQFASLLGISPFVYNRIIKGKQKPSLEVVENLYLKAGMRFMDIFIIEVS